MRHAYRDADEKEQNKLLDLDRDGRETPVSTRASWLPMVTKPLNPTMCHVQLTDHPFSMSSAHQ